MNVNQVLTYSITRMVLGPLVRAKLRLKCEGAENIPAEGGALLVANHRQPLLDPMSIALNVERPINFVALSLPVMNYLFNAFGAVTIDIAGGERSRTALDKSVDLLKLGDLVCIFPEGVHTLAKIHSVSKITTFRTGFARVALRAGVPLIPVAVIARGERNLPKIPPALSKKFFDHPEFQEGVQYVMYKRVLVRIGRPFDLGEYYDEGISKEVISQISGKIRRIVIKLYNGEDLDRFMTGETPFDIAYDRV